MVATSIFALNSHLQEKRKKEIEAFRIFCEYMYISKDYLSQTCKSRIPLPTREEFGNGTVVGEKRREMGKQCSSSRTVSTFRKERHCFYFLKEGHI